jgi:hypothetical protein
MKTLVKWFVKMYLTKKAVKEAIHMLNASFAAKVRAEGKEKVIAVANDVSTLISARLEGFADDGKIDDNELAAINAKDDAVLDKYLTDDGLESLIDKLMK